MPEYSVYVGSTLQHDAHRDKELIAPFTNMFGNGNYSAFGEWNGETEKVAIYQGEFTNDAAAIRVAYAIARATGNDAVMVTRYFANSDKDNSIAWGDEFRADNIPAISGNRTMVSDGDGGMHQYRFVRNPRGNAIAFLVGRDNSVKGVN